VNGSIPAAWREILERIFEGFSVSESISPAWLVNPQTGRRLKLDRYYPELGIAFRFVGLQGRQNYRPSEEETQAEADRNIMREYLCRQQGVTLVPLDVSETDVARLVGRIRSALGHTARLLAQSDVEAGMKRDLAPRIVRAQRRCDEVLRQMRGPDGMKLFADLWQDRHYAAAREPAGGPAGSQGRPAPAYRVGMVVEHLAFGEGIVQEVSRAGEDMTVTVRFSDGTEKRFLASLVGDKLLPRR